MAVINEEDLQEYLEEQRALAEAPTEVDIPVAQVQEAPAQEFTNWDSYTSDPEYQTLDSAEKQELYDRWRQYATNYLASTGNLTTKDDLEFTKSYFSGIAEQEGLKGADYKPPNYAEQLIQQGQSGYRSLESGVAGYGALIGVADTESAANAIAERNRQEQEKYISPEFQDYSNKKLGFFGAVKEIVTNPFDLALPFLAQSMGSNLPALASSLGIAGVGGAVAGPAGAASAGLYSSAILGGATDALVTVDQLIKEEVQKRGLNPTDPQAVASVLADPEFKTYAIKYANARGLAIGATGLAAFGLGNILAAPAREIAKAGVRGIAGEVGKQIGIQVVSEPVGEVAAQAGAQVATGQPIDIKGREVAEELVIGLPMSGVEAATLTYKNLVENSAPASADQVLLDQISEQNRTELQGAVTRNEADTFYKNLSIGEKVKVLDLAPNAILSEGQNVFDTLTPEEKQRVDVALKATQQITQPPVLAREEIPAPAGEQPPVLVPKAEEAPTAGEPPVLIPTPTALPAPTLAEAEAEAAQVFAEPIPTPSVVEAQVTPQEAVREAGAEAGVPAPAPETTAPISEAVQVPLEQVAPASAQAVAEEQAPVAEAPAPVPIPEAPAPVAEAPAVEAPATQEKDLKEIISDAADSQRGKPESVMMDVTMKLKDETASSPSLIDLLEHVGDLSNRAQKRNAITNVEEKIRKVERYGQDGRNTLEKEIEQGYRDNAEYRVLKSIPELAALKDRVGEPGGPTSLFEVYERVRKEHGSKIEAEIKRSKEIAKQELKKYVEAHEKFNKPVTKLGKLGKDAAIALGNQDFNKLRSIVSEMRKWVDTYNKANEQKRDKMFNELAGKPTTAPVTQKLPPTKKQVTALSKLGYLPADIEGLDRTQAKDIVSKQTPKTPTIEAPKEKVEAPAQAGTPAPAVPPAPVVGETPATSAQPPAGEVSPPVAPPAGQPTAPQTAEERLAQAEEQFSRVAETLQTNLAGTDIQLDAESVASFLGPNPNPEVQARLGRLLKILNTALANVKREIEKKGSLGRGRNLKEAFTNIEKIVIDPNARGGGGLYADPRNPYVAGVLFLNPNQLARVLMSSATTNPGDFLVKMLEEEILHISDGKAMLSAFIQKFPRASNPEIYANPESIRKAFEEFYDQSNREIEQSLSVSQIKQVLGPYAESLGLDLEGKSKEQIIGEFNRGRPGRLAEEYVRAIIQLNNSGSITEDTIKSLVTKPILRLLGALRTYLKRLVGDLGTGVKSRKTIFDNRYDAIQDILANKTSPRLIREAIGEATTVPSTLLASSADPIAQEEARLQQQDNKDLSEKIDYEFDERVRLTDKEIEDAATGKKERRGRSRAAVEAALSRSFPTIRDRDEIRMAVNDALREAIGSYNDQKGSALPTYVYRLAANRLLRVKQKILKERARTPYSFDAPGFFNVSPELRSAEAGAAEVERLTSGVGWEQIETAPTKRRSLTPEQKEAQRQALLARPTGEEATRAEIAREETALAGLEQAVEIKPQVTSYDEPLEMVTQTLADGEKISAADAKVANKITSDMLASQNELTQKLGDALVKLQDRTNIKNTARDAEIIQYVSGASDKTRAEISEQYGLTNDQFTKIRDDLMIKLRDLLVQDGISRRDVPGNIVYASSIDPTYSQALNRAVSTIPRDIALRNALTARVIESYVEDEVMRKANAFVDSNSPGNDIMYAKRVLDGNKGIPFEERIVTLGVIGRRLRDAVQIIDDRILLDQTTKGGTTPENLALRDYLANNLGEVLSVAQELASRAGQDLRATRILANMFLPYAIVKQYTGPIFNQQKEVLDAKEEIRRLREDLAALQAELAGASSNGGFTVLPPTTPDEGPRIVIGERKPDQPVPEGESFYQLLAAFGDMAPTTDENFYEYLIRLGIPYEELVASIEGVKASAATPTGPSRVLPEGLQNLPASEAIQKLLAIDKNLFSKLVSLRIKSGKVATNQDLEASFDRRKIDTKALQARPNELQTVFDFFNSTLSEKPTEPQPIEKDPLPPLVRLAKYAADAVTGRVLRSLGVDQAGKTKEQQTAFAKLESEVRKLVNAQFKQETNPTQVATEDTRSVEQRLLDAVKRIELSEQVFNQVQGNLRSQLAEDTRRREAKAEGQLTSGERKRLEDIAAKTFNANAVRSLDSLLRQVVDFKAEARKHLTQRGASVLSLTNIVKEKFTNFTEKQAESLAKLIAVRYGDLVKKAGERQLANIVRRIGDKEEQAPKKSIDQMLELINLGAFDDEKFYNVIADRYTDLPSWDPAVVTEIKKRADRIQRLTPDSDQAATESISLQAYIANEMYKQQKGWDKLGRQLDVASALWKAGVLSGLPTQIVNLGATNINVVMELITDANAYAKASRKKGLEGKFGDYLATALFAYIEAAGRMGVEQAGDAVATGLSRFRNEKKIELNPLETFKFDSNKPWSFNNYISAWKLVGRAMAAADTYNSVIANEAKARMAARYSLLQQGLTAEQTTKKAQDIFNKSNPEIINIRQQVAQEEAKGEFGSLAGLQPKTQSYREMNRKIEAGKRRRFNQLRDKFIEKEAGFEKGKMDSIREFAQFATFNNTPTGLIGYLGGAVIGGIAGKTKLLTPFVAFPRTIASIINSGLNYTPYGWLRANGFSLGNISGAIRDSEYRFKKPEPGSVEYYQLQTKAFYGSLVAFTLIGLAMKDIDKDWDEAFFAVTGRGPTDQNQKEQLMQAGWRENSVKIGPLKFRHTDFPGLNTIFGAMALVSDQYRYGKLSEKDFITVASTAALSVANSIFDKQLLSGMKTLFDAVSDRGDASDKAKKIIQSYSAGFLNPGIARWMTRTFDIGADGMVGVTDYKELNATSGGFLIGLTPLAVVAGKPKLNRLGEEIREYPWAATEKRFGILPTMAPHPVFTPLVRGGLFVPGASINLKINARENGKPVQRKMDREEYYNYSKYNGEYLKRLLTPAKAESLARMARTNQDAAQKQLEKMADRAKDYAKTRIEAEVRRKR